MSDLSQFDRSTTRIDSGLSLEPVIADTTNVSLTGLVVGDVRHDA